jgi:hypothetical protein
MAPISTLNVLCAQETEIRYVFLSSHIQSQKINPLQFLQQGRYLDSFPFTGNFLHLPQIHHKNFPEKKKFFLFSKALEKNDTYCPLKAVANGNRRPIQEPYLEYASGPQ